MRMRLSHESIAEIPANGPTCTLNGQRRLSPDDVARYLFEKVIPGADHANVFLENGARLYLDTGFDVGVTRAPQVIRG